MDSESMVFRCLGLFFINPIGVIAVSLLQTVVNVLVLPLSAFGVTPPKLISMLTGGLCNY